QTVGGLVTAAQRFNRTSTPNMLVQSDPLDAARAARVLKTLIPAIHEKSSALRAEIVALENLENSIAAEQAAQKEALDKIHSEEKKLSSLLAQRRALFEQTAEERRNTENEVARLTREAKNLDELVEKIQRPL